MAERFFAADAARGGRLVLQGDEARHLARVRRVGVGETVVVFDGLGFATEAEVVRVGKDEVELEPVGTPLPDRAPLLRLTLATAVPKGDRFDWLVEKATELDVARLQPILASRSVVDPRTGKLDRLRRAVIEASKQCGRNRLMTIDPPVRWDELLRHDQAQARLVLHPSGASLEGWRTLANASDATIAVGPEGGFTDVEVAEAVAAGWRAVSLGSTLLRIETAAIAGCARALAAYEWAI